MSETFKIFEDWLTEAIPSEVHRSYDRALQKLSLCMEYEEKLVSFEEIDFKTITPEHSFVSVDLD